METIYHTLLPIYDANSRILILGTFPSPKSRAQGFYYGHPQNRFWHVLSTVLQEPLPSSIEEKRAMLLRRGIALWDVLASCKITGAADSSIRDPISRRSSQQRTSAPYLQPVGLRQNFIRVFAEADAFASPPQARQIARCRSVRLRRPIVLFFRICSL